METNTPQTGSLVTIKSTTGQAWQARLVRIMDDGDLIVRRHDGLVHELAVERVVSIGHPSDASWC